MLTSIRMVCAAATLLVACTAYAEIRAMHAAPMWSCYATVGVQPPSPRAATIVLMDATTPPDEATTDNLLRVVQRAFGQRGELVVGVRFAGLAAGEFPREFARALQEPAPSEAFRNEHVIADVTRLERCLPRLWSANASAFVQALRRQIASTSEGSYSEIMFAYRWVVSEMVPALGRFGPVRVVVYSDGLEHSRSGRSFYRNREPRLLDVDAELRQGVVAADATYPPSGTATHSLYWVGLGTLPADRRHYLTPDHLESLRRFWTRFAIGLGASEVSVGTALPPEAFR
jgi:hypothetical protein